MKSKQELIEKWESAIEEAEFYGKGKEERLIRYMKDFVSDLNQLDEPEVTLDEPEILSQEWVHENKEMYLINDTSENAVPAYKLQNLFVPKQEEITELDALNRLAQNVQFSADEIASHLEKLSAHNGQVTYGEPETLSHNWIDEHRKSYTMEDSVEISDLQNLLVPKQEEVDQAYKDGYEKGKEYTFYKGYLEGLADKESEPEKVIVPQFVADWITNHREKFDLYPALKKLEGNPFGWERTYEWYRVNTHEFVNVYLTGEYEVEEEQKYYVIDKEDNILLIRGYGGIEKADNLKITNSGGGALKLTEQEIKDYDPRYWAFAERVEQADFRLSF